MLGVQIPSILLSLTFFNPVTGLPLQRPQLRPMSWPAKR